MTPPRRSSGAARARVASLVAAFVVVAACVETPPAWAPSPVASGPTSEVCLHARALRGRAPGLFEEGRLDRAARALARAEGLCPAEAQATWALRVRALAELGRATEALQLAARIERSDRADDADRAAAAAARRVAEERARAIAERGNRRDAPELFDPADRRHAEAEALFHRGADASRAGDHAAAKRLFLDAWQAWHPDPSALIEAGLEARAEGKRAEAQALWDRAAYDDATAAARPAIVDGAPAFRGEPAIAWSPAGDRLAVAGDRAVLVFDGELRPMLRLNARELVLAVAFGADGGHVYVALESGVIQVFDARTGVALRDLVGHHAPVRVLAASPDGRILVAASDDGSVGVWDARALSFVGFVGTRRAATREAPVILAFDDASSLLAVGEDDGRILWFSLPNLSKGGTLPARGPVRAMRFVGGAREPVPSLEVVTAGERVRWAIPVTAPARPSTIARVRTERASAASIGARTIVAAIEGGEPEVVALTDLAGKEAFASLSVRDHGGAAGFSLAPSGDRIAVVYRDRAVAVLPAGEPREPRLLAPAGPVGALAASPDGKTLVAAEDARVLVWRVAGERLRAHELGRVRALALAPDGRTLAVALDGAHVDLRDLEGRVPDCFLDTGGAVDCLAFSPHDGARLAACTAAPAVEVFGPGAARALLRLDAGPVRDARFAPDGASVLVASREGLTLWRPATDERLRLSGFGPEVRDAAFSADGSAVIAVSQRGELLLGKPGGAAPAHTVAVPAQALALAVGRDGTIATAEGDRAVALRSAAGKAFHRFRDPEATLRAFALLPGGVAAGLADGTVRVYRAPEIGPVAILRAAPGLPAGKLAGVVSGPRGHLEIVGPDADAARAALRCRLGAVYYPFEVCAEQFAVDGLLALALAGKDPAEADP